MLAKLFFADTPPRRICKEPGGFPEHFRALFFSIGLKVEPFEPQLMVLKA